MEKKETRGVNLDNVVKLLHFLKSRKELEIKNIEKVLSDEKKDEVSNKKT